jgi:hypothetical protein
MIARGRSGVYTGGRGVIVRNPFDGYSDDKSKAVVPASFWVNDIFAVSQVYPSGDPRLPVSTADDDPWERATLVFVVGTAMSSIMPDFDNIQEPSWGLGVFYAADSNSVDHRCRWLPDKNLYDCPGGIIPWAKPFIEKKIQVGSGGYPFGNPHVNADTGGGTGCHFGKDAKGHYVINQFNGNDGKTSLLANRHCECNYAYKKESWDPVKNGWDAWVDQFHTVAMANVTVNTDMMDLAQCWVNNARDLINLQNAIWWKRTDWNNQKSPMGDYVNSDDYVRWRRYWGWNEVPVPRTKIQNPLNWDAVVIYLPAGSCRDGMDTPECLSSGSQSALVDAIDQWISAGYLKPGGQYIAQRPGSYMLFVRQIKDSNGNYQASFFCQTWQAPRNYKVVYEPMSATNPTGKCWLDAFPVENGTTTKDSTVSGKQSLLV